MKKRIKRLLYRKRIGKTEKKKLKIIELLVWQMFKAKILMEMSLSSMSSIGDGSNVQIVSNCSEKIKWPAMEAMAA